MNSDNTSKDGYKKTERLRNVGYDIRGPLSDVAARMAADGIDVTQLNTGNPAYFGIYAPEYIKDTLIKNLKASEAYSDSAGLIEARLAIKTYCESKNIKNVDVDNIFTGNGVSELISIALQALLNDGDEILMPAPDYPLWTSTVTLCGGKVIYYKCDEENDWLPDIEDIKSKVTEKTRGIVIINPNNPTGALYPKKTLMDIIDVARENELILFSDEIYDRLVMAGEEHIATASLANDVLVITMNGLSKSHMVAGYRSAWMVISGCTERAKDYIYGVKMLASMRMCANVPAQSIIKVALEHPNDAAPLLAPGGRIYEQCEYIHEAINAIPGLSAVKPKAAFYIFPKIDVERFNITDDEQFMLDFLKKHHILMTHGRGFNYPYPDHFRIVYLSELDKLKELSTNLRAFLKSYSQK